MATLLPPPPTATAFSTIAWTTWLQDIARLLSADPVLLAIARIPPAPETTPWLKSDKSEISWEWLKWLVAVRRSVNLLIDASASCLGVPGTGKFRPIPPPPEPTPFHDSKGRVSWEWIKWLLAVRTGVNVTLTDGRTCLSGEGMNLDVVYELVSRPQQSSSTTAKTYHSSWTQFDPSWFDGTITWWMEIEGQNDNASNDYQITIQDKDTLETVHAITVPAGQARTWVREEFTPLSGLRTYELKLDQTASGSDLKCWKLRIRIAQRGATTTRLQIVNMAGGAINQNDLVFGDSRFTFGDSGYIEESQSALFLKEAGAWATVDHWTLESVAGNTGLLGTNHCYVSLNRASDAAQVLENDHIVESSDTELIATDFADAAANFDDDEEFGIYSRATATSANNSLVLKVSLYVTLTALSKAAIYYWAEGRQFIDAAGYDQLVTAHFEITGTESGAGDAAWELATAEDPEDSSAETPAAASEIDPVGATKDRYRVDVALPAGEKFYDWAGVAGTGSIELVKPYLILKSETV